MPLVVIKLMAVSAPKAKALGFLLQRPNLRQHVYHWRRGSCLHRREFPQAPLRYCTSTTCISTWVHRSSRQQYYTQRWHLCRRRIHNRDKHALGSTSLSVPRYHSYCIFVWCYVSRHTSRVRYMTATWVFVGFRRYFIVVIMRRHLLDQFIFNCSNLFSEPASHPKAKALGFPGRNQ